MSMAVQLHDHQRFDQQHGGSFRPTVLAVILLWVNGLHVHWLIHNCGSDIEKRARWSFSLTTVHGNMPTEGRLIHIGVHGSRHF